MTVKDYTFKELVGEAKLRNRVGSVIGQPWPHYTWPGCYTMAYFMDDSEEICADCMSRDSNPIHFTGLNDGWKVIGADAYGANIDYPDNDVCCANCGKVIISGSESED